MNENLNDAKLLREILEGEGLTEDEKYLICNLLESTITLIRGGLTIGVEKEMTTPDRFIHLRYVFTKLFLKETELVLERS